MSTRLPVRRRGMGKYPDQTCFDPNRSSWLPNWIDSFDEIACDANLLLCGNQTCDNAQPGQFKTITNPDGSTSQVPAANPATLANAKAACIANSGTWDDVNVVCVPNSLDRLLSKYGLYIGGGLLLAVLL